MEHSTALPSVDRRTLLRLAAALGAWLALLYAFRFGFMEIEAEADPCLSDPLGSLCRVRALLGMSIHLQLFGSLALVLALAAHLRLGRLRHACALAALFVAALALVLYNVRYGAPALVVASIALADLGRFRHASAEPL